MKDKGLKNLSRKQLLELLLAQTERADELEKKLHTAKVQLRRRELAEMEAGNLAEAALKLNGVFEAAQAAAEQYLENVKARSTSLSASETSDALAEAEDKLAEIEALCLRREAECEKKLAEITSKIEHLRAVCREFDEFYSNSVNKETTEDYEED
ncbi:MAG: hypothetical protein IJ499_00555 [Clostridia bacterium]|nr:hypothetical protein [Clostridia bacterium]